MSASGAQSASHPSRSCTLTASRDRRISSRMGTVSSAIATSSSRPGVSGVTSKLEQVLLVVNRGPRRPATVQSARRRREEQTRGMSNADAVRAFSQAYLSQDRVTAERLLAEDFVFTSPQDDHIGKA